jgi:dUTPase
VIQAGEAIGQMVILPVVTPAVEEVSAEEIHRQGSSRGGTGGIVDQFKG